MTWLWVVAPLVLLGGGALVCTQLVRLEAANRERSRHLDGLGRTVGAIGDLRHGIGRLRRRSEALRARGDSGHGEPAL